MTDIECAQAKTFGLRTKKDGPYIGTATLEMETQKKVQILDITDCINKALGELDMRIGSATIASMHTTTALFVQEPECNLFRDIIAYLGKLVPEGVYHHDDLTKREDCPPDEPLNATAHIQTMLLGNSIVWPYENRQLMLGRYQRVLFTELDGPCPRPGKNQSRIIVLRMLGV